MEYKIFEDLFHFHKNVVNVSAHSQSLYSSAFHIQEDACLKGTSAVMFYQPTNFLTVLFGKNTTKTLKRLELQNLFTVFVP